MGHKSKPKKAKSEESIASVWGRGAYYAFHLLAFILPLAIFPFSYDNYDLPKAVLFRSFVLFIYICWLIGQFFSRRNAIRRSGADVLVTAFLLLTLLATAFSVDLPTSLWGKYERYEGFFTLLAYGMLFFLAVQVVNDTKRIRALSNTLIAATALVSLYGLIQYLGFDFVSWGEQAFEAKRASSTFGNPILLAGYLTMMLPVMFVRFVEEKSGSRAVLYAFSILIAFGVLLVTFSRGGWIAFLVAALFLIATQGKKMLSRRVLALALFVALILLAVAWVGYVGSFAQSQNPSLGERVKSVADTREGSTATRLLIWQSALKLIKARPWLGYGPDTFHLAYPSQGSLRYAQLVERWSQPDNAHNYLLQLGSTTGLVGLWLFLSIMVFVIWRGTNTVLKTKGKDGILFAGLLAGILAYLVHLQFSINAIDSGVTFWLLLGLVCMPHSRETRMRRGVVIPLASVSLLATLLIVGGSLCFLAADMHFLRAEENASLDLGDLAAREYRKAVELNPYQNLYLISLGRLYSETGSRERNQKLLSRAENCYLEGQRKNPRELDNYVFLGDLFLRAASFDSKYYSLAEKELEKALRIYPFWADTHSLLGKLYLDTNRLRRAESHYKMVVLIDSTDARAYLYLARIYHKTRRWEAAYEAYNQVLNRDSQNLEAKRGLGELARVGGAVTQNP